MSELVNIIIDRVPVRTEKGKFITDAARENNIYIPTLCNMSGVTPKGCCRMCNIKINGRYMTACTTPVAEGMEIENNTGEINEFRKSILELLFVSGNHFCPACEKSGNCELQALAYRFGMMAPKFPYQFPQKNVDASNPLIIKEQNRCIMCKRCIKTIKDQEGRPYFVYRNRAHKIEVILDPEMGSHLTPELAELASLNCPVGSIIFRGKGFSQPIGTRKYDLNPIGSEVEHKTI